MVTLSSIKVFLLVFLIPPPLLETKCFSLPSSLIEDSLANIVDDLSDHNILILTIPKIYIPDESKSPTLLLFCVHYSKVEHYLRAHPFSFPEDVIDVNTSFPTFKSTWAKP